MFFTGIFDSQYFYEIVGLSVKQYKLLLKSLANPQFQGSQNKKLLLTIIKLRQNLPFVVLSWIFQVSIQTARDYFNETLHYLHFLYKDSLTVPSLKERYKSWFKIDDELYTIIIDGMEQRITSSSNKDVSYSSFSGKKKFHSFTKLIGVNRFGNIWFLSGSYLGALNDLNLVSFPENFIFRKLLKKEKIMGDNGFKGMTHLQIYTEPKEKELSSLFKHYRSVVENVIAHLRMFKICSHTFECYDKFLVEDLKKHEKIFVVVCGLMNSFKLPIRYQKQ